MPGKESHEDLALDIAVAKQQITVDEQSSNLQTSPESNAGAIVIKDKDLDALSDDPDQLQDELNALAGPAAGPNGGEIYIDGFTGGQLPPKSSIREIRINQNPFSAEYDKLGYGRIEILTKPGTDKLHGMLLVNGNDSAFNSLNTFVSSEPAYYSTFLLGNVSGSFNSRTSWFFSGFRRDNQANSIINAQLLTTDGQTYDYIQAVPNPQTRLDLSPRLDQRRYSLTLAAMGGNIFNNVNLSPPVGVLESPLFGKSTALAGGFFSSTSFESQY
jgi:hypothetical protein